MRALPIDECVLARARKIAAALRTMVPDEGVIEQKSGRRHYVTDGRTAYRALPRHWPQYVRRGPAELGWSCRQLLRPRNKVNPESAGEIFITVAAEIAGATVSAANRFGHETGAGMGDPLSARQMVRTPSSCGADLPFQAFYFIPLNPLFRLSMNGVPHRP
jgi:hypothetical protein